eukprot:997412-Rhodomonas_salina.1
MRTSAEAASTRDSPQLFGPLNLPAPSLNTSPACSVGNTSEIDPIPELSSTNSPPYVSCTQVRESRTRSADRAALGPWQNMGRQKIGKGLRPVCKGHHSWFRVCTTPGARGTSCGFTTNFDRIPSGTAGRRQQLSPV